MNPVYNLFTPSSIFKKGAPPKNHHFYHKHKEGKNKTNKKQNPHCDFLLLLYHLGQKAYYKEIIRKCRILMFPILSKLYI